MSETTAGCRVGHWHLVCDAAQNYFDPPDPPDLECECVHAPVWHEDLDGACGAPLEDSLGTRYGTCECEQYTEAGDPEYFDTMDPEPDDLEDYMLGQL